MRTARIGAPMRYIKGVIGWQLRWLTWPRRFHYWRAVPGWFSYRDLYRSTVASAAEGAHFVEIGCWEGQSAVFMAVEIANSGKSIRFDCVDHWQETDMQRFLDNIAPVAGFINPIRSPSVEAAARYVDHSLDFVMIDAGHKYEEVLADLAAWAPKVKAGGILAGDDFNWPGVEKAVREVYPQARAVDRCQWLVQL